MLSPLSTLTIPDQYIGLLVEFVGTETQFLLNILEDFLNVSIVGDLHILDVHPCPFKLIFYTLNLFPGAP